MSNLYHHRVPALNGMDIYPLVKPQHQHSPGHDDSIYQDSIDDVLAQGDFEAYGGAASDPIDVEERHDPFTGQVVDGHPNTPSIYLGGTTFMDQFFNDKCAGHHKENLYYPFALEAEWKLASWLLCSCLSMAAIDDFLSLPLVR